MFNQTKRQGRLPLPILNNVVLIAKEGSMFLKIFWFVFIGGLMFCLWTPGYAAILNFNMSNPTPLIGETFTVDIEVLVTGLVEYNLDIGFTPGTLAVEDVSPGLFLRGGGPTLSSFGAVFFDLSTPGQIQNIIDSIVGPTTGASGIGVLTTITFRALNAGTSPLTFLDVNTPGGTLLSTVLAPDPITSAPAASVNVVVPEPTSFPLLVTGVILFGLAQARRRLKLKLSRDRSRATEV